MSTKHLEALVETAIVAAQKHEVGPEAAVIIDRARRELEEIRRAAKELIRPDSVPTETQRAYDLMRSIAREAK